MKSLRYLLLPLLLLVVLAAGCGSSAKKGVPADAVAVVGDQTITKTHFNDLLAGAKRRAAAQKQAFPKPGTASYKTLQDQAMAYLVQESEFVQKGKTLGVTITPKAVAAQLATIKKQYSPAAYKKALKAQGMTEADLDQSIFGSLLQQKLAAKITAGVKVSPAAVQAYYTAHKADYTTAASRTVRHILVSSKATADQLETQLKAGADFATLAKKYSKDTASAKNGGKLTISKGQTVASFDKEAFALKVGETSPPVHSQYGWHIIQALTAITPAKVQSFASTKATIATNLLSTKKTTTLQNWAKGVTASFAKSVSYQTGYAPSTTSTSTTTTG